MKRSLHILLSFLLCIAVCSGSFCVPVKGASASSSFQIDFIDVGQGDAILVQCDGHYMLVDGGNSRKSGLIYSYLNKRKITYLDQIVGTHADADHIGGLAGALNYAKVGTAYCSETYHDSKAFRSFAKYLRRQGKTIIVPSCGDQFSLGSAEVTVVGPVKNSPEPNNRSIVLRIVYGNTSFLLTGDAEKDEEKDITEQFEDIQSTVLKVGHHGSSSSTSYRFLRAVAPSYAVISAGTDNKYGHPTEKTLSRLRDADVKTYRTDLQGSIICTSDGDTVSFTTSKNPDINTLDGAGPGQNNKNTRQDPVKDMPDAGQPTGTAGEQESIECTYILNKNTKKIHRPDCSSVSDMSEKNKIVFNGTRDEVIAQGYQPCKRCNP